VIGDDEDPVRSELGHEPVVHLRQDRRHRVRSEAEQLVG
jgi:hypothetical protein